MSVTIVIRSQENSVRKLGPSVDLGGAGTSPPLIGFNSFVLTYVYREKHLLWRSVPPKREILIFPLGNLGSICSNNC